VTTLRDVTVPAGFPDRIEVPGLGPVSVLGAGCWTIGGAATNRGVPIGWGDVDPDAAYQGLERAHTRGVTLYDTADVYGLGASERLLGRLLHQVDRSRLVVSSKVGYFAGTAAHPYQPDQMRRQLETTLANLRTSYLDAYHLHSGDFGDGDRHLCEAVAQMRRFKEEGVVRAIGMRAPHEFATEWATGTGTRAATSARFLHLFDLVQPDVITVRHSLLAPVYRPDETDIFAFAQQRGTGVIIKQALGQGLLTGSHPPGKQRTFPEGDHRSQDPYFRADTVEAVWNAVQVVRAMFGPDPQHLIRVALAYALQTSGLRAPVLVGFRDPAQIEQNIAAFDAPLTAGQISHLQEVMRPVRESLKAATQQARAVPHEQTAKEYT
jgi:aryl-alcohol dehydrogenase-like predicted oxidoreductase